MKTEANVTQAIPFFRVSNMVESIRFYLDGLGFVITNQWAVDGKLRWCQLRLGDARLMLQEFPKEGHDSWVPQCKVGEGVAITFQCRDAVAIYRDLKSRGVNVSRPFVGNGMWVTSVSDPDGYKMDFESFTDAAEESELPE